MSVGDSDSLCLMRIPPNVSTAALTHFPVPLFPGWGSHLYFCFSFASCCWDLKKKKQNNLGEKGLNSAHNSRLQPIVAGRSRCKNLRLLVISTAKSRTRVKRLHALLSLLPAGIPFRTSCLGKVATHVSRWVFLHQVM